ncbi:MAG TPA: 50S ribosomal protein L25 [Desulfobulbus sp.]|nr:50S ribosomal protein L25 [Desulfobulbus sp.]
MLQVTIPSTVRTVFGKGPMRQLRMNGKTPAILYSGGNEPVSLEFDAGLLFKNLLFIHGRNAVVTLEIEGDGKGTRQVLVQEIQKDPVTDRLVHVDFLEIELDKALDFVVPVEFTGVARGVDMGGELQILKDTAHLRGCPLDIPDSLTADITELDRGEAGVTFGDLQLPAQVEMLEDATVTCVQVL